MTQTVKIPAFSPKPVIVLAVNRPEEVLRKATKGADRKALISDLLGRTDAAMTHVDLVAVQDLDEIGLTGFLRDGPGVPAQELVPYRARLDALEGFVLILYPGVFNVDTEVALGADLSLIAVLNQEPTHWEDAHALRSDAATELTPGKKIPSDAAMSGRVAMVALLAIALLTWVMVWIA